MWWWRVAAAVVVVVGSGATKPIVDPGLFVIQGVTSCLNGTGYCMLGNNCSVDVDFLPDATGGHCKGLRDAFTPNIDFVCCRYNPLGKATSEPPTTTLASFTITDAFSVLDEYVLQQQQQEELDYENLNPENLIDIVGVVTDFTGIIGLVTRPWTGTLPTRAPTPSTTPITTTPTTAAPLSPATPPDGHMVHTQTPAEVLESDQTTEVTESYHEVPTDLEEPPVVPDGDHQSSAVVTEGSTPHTTTSQRSPTPPPNAQTNNGADDMNVIYLPQFPFLNRRPAGGDTQAVEEVPDTVVPDGNSQRVPQPPADGGSNDMNVIVFPKNPSGVDNQALEQATVTTVPDGDSKTSAVEDSTQVVESNSILEVQDGGSRPSGTDGHDAGQGVDGSVVETVSGHGNATELHVPGMSGVDGQQSGVVGVGGVVPGVGGEMPGVGGEMPGEVDVGGEEPGMGGAGENIDYDYYSQYPDQLLLQPVNQNICGFKGLKNYDPQPSSSRILGGLVASTIEWCWVAAIMERRQGGDKYVCSGALVESNLVISTATCLKRLDTRDLTRYLVVLGDSNLREDLPYGIQFHSLAEVDTHPDYFTSGGAHANDIGIVRLAGQATLSDNVCLVCMAQQDAIFPAHTCTVTGYGIGHVPHTMITDVRDVVPSDGVLRQLSVPLLKKAECRTALHNVTGSTMLASSDSFLCAGGMDQTSACYSTMDGGSPLACEAGGRWFVAGLVSWSKDCTQAGTPNVYTRVSSYTNWLQATYLRMLGFLTPHAFTSKQRWMYQHLYNINKEFA
nr:uncharacterized protein LOC123772386 [Procambarus clarkii]